MFRNFFAKLLSSKSLTPAKRRGNDGEAEACRYLESLGCRILARNWRTKFGELDIVCMEGEIVVFVEVKAAGKESEFLPERRVTPEKQRRIKRLARAFLAAHKLDAPRRYDIIAMTWKDGRPEVKHFTNAFV